MTSRSGVAAGPASGHDGDGHEHGHDVERVRAGARAAACGQRTSGLSHALELLRAQRSVAVRLCRGTAFRRLTDAHERTLLDRASAHPAQATPLGVVSTDGVAR